MKNQRKNLFPRNLRTKLERSRSQVQTLNLEFSALKQRKIAEIKELDGKMFAKRLIKKRIRLILTSLLRDGSLESEDWTFENRVISLKSFQSSA